MQAKPFRVLVAAILLLNIAAFSQEAQKKVSRSEAETAVLTRVQPEYPNAARQLKIQGAVELEAMVNAAGDVEKVNIVSGNPVLTRPAAEAVQATRKGSKPSVRQTASQWAKAVASEPSASSGAGAPATSCARCAARAVAG